MADIIKVEVARSSGYTTGEKAEAAIEISADLPDSAKRALFRECRDGMDALAARMRIRAAEIVREVEQAKVEASNAGAIDPNDAVLANNEGLFHEGVGDAQRVG